MISSDIGRRTRQLMFRVLTLSKRLYNHRQYRSKSYAKSFLLLDKGESSGSALFLTFSSNALGQKSSSEFRQVRHRQNCQGAG